MYEGVLLTPCMNAAKGALYTEVQQYIPNNIQRHIKYHKGISFSVM